MSGVNLNLNLNQHSYKSDQNSVSPLNTNSYKSKSTTHLSWPVEEDARPGESDFFWTYTEEPHRSRRQAIIKSHPEVLKLCGPEPKTKYIVSTIVILQILIAYAFRNTLITSPKFWIVSYSIGATANHGLYLAIHELSHNLGFRKPSANRLFSIFANLPIGIPYSASFRPYHLTHHKFMGVDGLDADLPSPLEALFLDSLLGKAFFCTFQILFFAIRPLLLYRLPVTSINLANIAVQFMLDFIILRYLGFTSMAYLLVSSILAGSLHPCAGHFVGEHYVFHKPASMSKNQLLNVPIPETYSYYGPLNYITFNVGYHNEHHDFPAVPWTRLPTLRKVASEYYQDLPSHQSWISVMFQFIVDKNVGIWCRVKRRKEGLPVGGGYTRSPSKWNNDELGFNEKNGVRIKGVH